jgi:hypothetical protein
MARAVADIQTDIALFETLRTKAATSGIAEYTEDSGQGRTSVKRITLGEIRTALFDLHDELLDAQDEAAGYAPGVVSYTGRRW